MECDRRSPGEGPVVLCNFQEAQVSKAPTASHSDPEVSAAGHQQAMGKVVKKSGAPTPLSPSSTPPPALHMRTQGCTRDGQRARPGLRLEPSAPIRECLHSSQGLGCQGE